MSIVKQTGLLPAGCQPWNKNVLTACGKRFAYCATLAVYVYQFDEQYKEFKLQSIVSEHKKTITAICWNEANPDIFASTSADNTIIVYDVERQIIVGKFSKTRTTPTCLAWYRHSPDTLVFASSKGPFYLWNYTDNDGSISALKDLGSFTIDVNVMRWHAERSGKLALGHSDGSISVFANGKRPLRHQFRLEDMEEDAEDAVTVLEWDPLSEDYLLVASSLQGLRLLDISQVLTIMTFSLPSASASINTMSWIHSAPGMFITGDYNVGVMRLWTVSKATPIENIKLKRTGFHALLVINPHDNEHNQAVNSAPSSASFRSQYALPPAKAVCTFMDGGVGLYDLGQRRWIFLREEGHIETIFDCKFKPDDADLLATASFDGTIKIWNVSTMDAVKTSPGNEGVIYCLSWAPADLNLIAACTSKNGAFVWDVTASKIALRLNEVLTIMTFSLPSASASINTMSWIHSAPGMFITGDYNVGVMRLWTVSKATPIENIKLKRTGFHALLVINPHDNEHNQAVNSAPSSASFRSQYALPPAKAVCTFMDGGVGLYDLGQRRWIFLREEGHIETIFDCKFKPDDADLLATASFDGTIKIWNVSTMDAVKTSPGNEGVIYCLSWAPADLNLIAACTSKNGAFVWDVTASKIALRLNEVLTIMTFSLPSASASINTMSWIHSAPGMFITGDYNVGVMRLWTVSKATPIENIKLKRTGFHALLVINPHDNEHNQAVNSAPSSASFRSQYALPPAKAVCTFMDGGVGLYDLGQRRWIFLREEGHIETIFDCKFKPDDADLLATASFDGTIKIWNVSTMDAVKTSPGNEGVIYCLSWAPADLNLIAACTSKNGAFVWDVTASKIALRFNEHSQGAVYSVAWNQKDPNRIATTGADGNCIVRQKDGKFTIRYKHPLPVYGCDWNPQNKDLLATGCEDKLVRVFYMTTLSEQPLKTFSGHTAKVFQVKWSPLRDGLLCSGSDDATVRIWDYGQDTCVLVLNGHTAPVRGLLWNTEVPFLLMSGSWDYSMRVWDVRDGTCLDTIVDHGADVYGLTSHPSRPFVVASCSRDSTVRKWHLTPLIQPIEMKIIAGCSLADVISSIESTMVRGSETMLTGAFSKQLCLESQDNPSSSLQKFSLFFANADGANNLWELLSVFSGKENLFHSKKYGSGIVHMKHLSQYKGSLAQKLEMQRGSRYGAGGVMGPTREERLKEAANLHISLGNKQKYCEIMVELHEWDKALAIAPGVSIDYWQKLTKRRVSSLREEDSSDVIPYYVAIGETEELISYFLSHGQLNEAMMAAVGAYEDNIKPPLLGLKPEKQQNNGEHHSYVMKTANIMAEWYLQNGRPLVAACCHLAVDDIQGALQKLLRGQEYEIAASVCLTLEPSMMEPVQDLKRAAIIALSRRCERLGDWQLGISLLKLLSGSEFLLAKLCCRCTSNMTEINQLHEMCHLPLMDECFEQAQSLSRRDGQVLNAVMYYLLSTHPEKGLELGLKEVKRILSNRTWRIDQIWEMLQLLSCMHTDKFQQNQIKKQRGDLLVLSAYVGAMVAISHKYDSIVLPLLEQTRMMYIREQCDLPLSLSQIDADIEAWTRKSGIEDYRLSVQSKTGKVTFPEGQGLYIVTGSQLPSHSDVHTSSLTGKRIQGPAYFLEDGRSAISISDALMWTKCNPFSPLGSGIRINPF